MRTLSPEERKEMEETYRRCTALAKRLRDELGFTRCPFCQEQRDREQVIYPKHREVLLAK